MGTMIHAKGRVVIDFDECIDYDEYGVFDEHGIPVIEDKVLKSSVCAYLINNIAQLNLEIKGLKVKAE